MRNHRVGVAVLAFASHAGDGALIPGMDRPQSLYQVGTAPLPNARH